MAGPNTPVQLPINQQVMGVQPMGAQPMGGQPTGAQPAQPYPNPFKPEPKGPSGQISVMEMTDRAKGLSDAQVKQAFRDGSILPYILLAEMNNRKAARDDAMASEASAQPSNVAEDLGLGLGGLGETAFLAEGGLVGYQDGGSVELNPNFGIGQTLMDFVVDYPDISVEELMVKAGVDEQLAQQAKTQFSGHSNRRDAIRAYDKRTPRQRAEDEFGRRKHATREEDGFDPSEGVNIQPSVFDIAEGLKGLGKDVVGSLYGASQFSDPESGEPLPEHLAERAKFYKNLGVPETPDIKDPSLGWSPMEAAARNIDERIAKNRETPAPPVDILSLGRSGHGETVNPKFRARNRVYDEIERRAEAKRGSFGGQIEEGILGVLPESMRGSGAPEEMRHLLAGGPTGSWTDDRFQDLKQARTDIDKNVRQTVRQVPGKIGQFFGDIPETARGWGADAHKYLSSEYPEVEKYVSRAGDTVEQMNFLAKDKLSEVGAGIRHLQDEWGKDVAGDGTGITDPIVNKQPESQPDVVESDAVKPDVAALLADKDAASAPTAKPRDGWGLLSDASTAQGAAMRLGLELLKEGGEGKKLPAALGGAGPRALDAAAKQRMATTALEIKKEATKAATDTATARTKQAAAWMKRWEFAEKELDVDTMQAMFEGTSTAIIDLMSKMSAANDEDKQQMRDYSNILVEMRLKMLEHLQSLGIFTGLEFGSRTAAVGGGSGSSDGFTVIDARGV